MKGGGLNPYRNVCVVWYVCEQMSELVKRKKGSERRSVGGGS